MNYFRMCCREDYLDAGFAPCTYMELDEDFYQCRVLELYTDKTGALQQVTYADAAGEYGVMLAEGSFLEVDRTSGLVDLDPVSQVEFETIWAQRARLRAACLQLQTLHA